MWCWSTFLRILLRPFRDAAATGIDVVASAAGLLLLAKRSNHKRLDVFRQQGNHLPIDIIVKAELTGECTRIVLLNYTNVLFAPVTQIHYHNNFIGGDGLLLVERLVGCWGYLALRVLRRLLQ